MTHIWKNRTIASFLTVMTISIALGIVITGCTSSSVENAGEPKPMAADADLVKATATNGKEGYIKKDELEAAAYGGNSPQEVAAIAEERTDVQQTAFCESLAAQPSAHSAEIAAIQADDGALFSQIMNRVDETLSFETTAAEFGLNAAELEAAYTAAREATSRHIPVYEVDGETVIGEFLVG